MGPQPILQYDVAYPERLSRFLIFVKWLLAIPHFIVLYLLSFALSVVSFLAWWIILITGRYPRGMWEFGMMVMRWNARVTAYLLLMRDDYPPFGESDYPVLFQMDYPERLSRWKIFIKWLLIIPHLFVIYIIWLIAGMVIFLSWWAILILGRYPRTLFDFITGFYRWLYRVMVYLYNFTDAYPPFTIDQVPSPTASAALSQPYGEGALPPRAW